MKKNLGISFVIFIMLCFSSIGIAQSYTTAGGIRLGTEWGATLQQRILKRVTLEGILQQGIIKEEFVITGLVERHYPLISKRFNVYLGGGLHKGWTTNPEATYDNPWGLTGIAGAEFSIGRLNISYDVKPSFNIAGGDEKVYLHTGLSARYIFVKQKVFNDLTKGNNKKKKQRQKAKRKKKKQKQKQKKKQGRDSNWKFWERL